MHDRNGTPIKKGDKVLIEAVVREEYGAVDYCNVNLAIGSERENGPDKAGHSHAGAGAIGEHAAGDREARDTSQSSPQPAQSQSAR